MQKAFRIRGTAAFFFVLLCLLLTSGSPAGQTAQSPPAGQAGATQPAEEEKPSPDEVRVIAHSQEKIKERVYAFGNVEVHYKDIKVFADRVEVNTETKDVLAEGNVVVQTPEENVSAEKLFLNLETSQGKLEKVYGMIQPTIFYEADLVEKKEENLYSFTKAKMTSCTQAVPRWKFSCSRANFRKNDYMEMWNSVLTIKRIPVFYLPYFRYPLDKERATGFLIPELGYSGRKGFIFSEGFYLVIKKNIDATFNLDYYSARGVGAGLETRYVFSSGAGGNLNLYHFDFKEDPARTDPANASIFRLTHRQPLPFEFNLSADIDYQTSFDFLREFDNNFKRAVVSNRRSQVYLTRSWSSFIFNARLSWFETYFSSIRNSIITTNLPQITFNALKIKLFSPLYFSLTSNFNSWQYGFRTAYDKDKQTRAQNLSFAPTLTVPFSEIPWFTLNTSFTTDFKYYSQSYSPLTRKPIDEPLLVRNYILDFDFVGPVFYKIYFGADKEPRLKHIIEPSVNYRYDSPIAQADRIITQTGFFQYHRINYGLTNRFLVKQNEMPREIVTLGVSQTFYLAPEKSPLSRFRVDGKIPEFTDITGYLRFYPTSKNSLDFSAGLNPYYWTFSSIRLGGNFGTPADNVFLRVNWFKGINAYNPESFLNRHQVGGFAGLNIPRLSLQVQGEFDYNIQRKKMLYSALSLVYDYQCLEFKTDIRVFYFREKPETQFRFSIGLGNIGKTTDFLGGLGW